MDNNNGPSPKEKRVNIRLTDDLHIQLFEECARESIGKEKSITVSAMVRELILDWLAKRKMLEASASQLHD